MKGRGQVNAPAGERWIYGVHAVERRLEKDPESVRELLLASSRSPRRTALTRLAEAARVPVRTGDDVELRRCAGSESHQGVVARAAAYRYADLHSLLETGAPLLVADQVHDPNNLGALARTAAAVGMGGIVLPERGAAGVTGAVEKAAAGAVNDLLICRVVNLVRALGELAEGGYWSIALVPQGGEDLFRLSLPEKPVLVLGGERGLRPLVQRKCDLQATIPVPGPIESLNASVAGAIAMYELFRRQKLG